MGGGLWGSWVGPGRAGPRGGPQLQVAPAGGWGNAANSGRGGGAAGRGHPHLSVCGAQPGLRGLRLHRKWTQATGGQDRGLSPGRHGWPGRAPEVQIRQAGCRP